MRVEELIKNLNAYADKLDFVAARKLIEENMDILEKKRYLLKGNARELLNFLIEREENGHKPISKQDMAALKAINSYASNFELSSLKFLVKERAQLLLNKEAVACLNKDAKVILEGMGVITKGSEVRY